MFLQQKYQHCPNMNKHTKYSRIQQGRGLTSCNTNNETFISLPATSNSCNNWKKSINFSKSQRFLVAQLCNIWNQNITLRQ